MQARQQTGRPKAEKFPPKCYSQIVTETPRPWDRRSTETTKAYAAFLAYIALGARRSVREALRQNSGETAVSGKLRTWEGWSSKNAWVSRANARDEWIARTSDDQIIVTEVLNGALIAGFGRVHSELPVQLTPCKAL